MAKTATKRKPRTNKKADTAEDQLELPVELPAAATTGADPTKFQMPERDTDKTPAGWKKCPDCKGFIKGPNTKKCPNCGHVFPAKIKADGKSNGKGSGKRGRPPGSKNATATTTASHAASEVAVSKSTVADAIKAARHFIDAAGGKKAAMELMELIGNN